MLPPAGTWDDMVLLAGLVDATLLPGFDPATRENPSWNS